MIQDENEKAIQDYWTSWVIYRVPRCYRKHKRIVKCHLDLNRHAVASVNSKYTTAAVKLYLRCLDSCLNISLNNVLIMCWCVHNELLPSFWCSFTFLMARLYNRICEAKSSTNLVVKYGTRSMSLALEVKKIESWKSRFTHEWNLILQEMLILQELWHLQSGQ